MAVLRSVDVVVGAVGMVAIVAVVVVAVDAVVVVVVVVGGVGVPGFPSAGAVLALLRAERKLLLQLLDHHGLLLHLSAKLRETLSQIL